MKHRDLSALDPMDPDAIDEAIRRAHLLRAEFVRDVSTRLFGRNRPSEQRLAENGDHHLHHKGVAPA